MVAGAIGLSADRPAELSAPSGLAGRAFEPRNDSGVIPVRGLGAAYSARSATLTGGEE
jgi:hypothetical protein